MYFLKQQMYAIHHFQLEEAFDIIKLNKMGCLNPSMVEL